MCAPAKTIACGADRARRPRSRAASRSRPPCDERGASVGGLPRIAPSWTTHAVADHDAVVDDDVGAERTSSPDRRRRAEDEAGRGVVVHGGYPRGAVAAATDTAPARRGARPGDDRPPPRPPAPGHARASTSPAPSTRAATASAPSTTRRSCRGSIAELLGAGRRTSPIVAVPTEEPPRPRCASWPPPASHVLVEKPLAATRRRGARAHRRRASDAGVHGAVGHVERFNPALLELRRRVLDGQLGEVFLIATERVGPFPDRVRDVGVVKDLATHDLDLVALARRRARRVASPRRPQHRDGPRARGPRAGHRPRSTSGVSFNCIVDWLSPTKVRRTRVLGERGMLVADTLTADLTFFENGRRGARSWAAAQAMRGVSEGDMTRYALARREPLLVELEAFAALRRRRRRRRRRHARPRAWRPSPCAEAVLESAATGETVVLGSGVAREGRRRRAGQGRAAARRRDRARRARGRGLRRRPARRRRRQRRPRAVPQRGRARRGAAEAVADGRLRATTDTPPRSPRAPTSSSRCRRSWSTTAARPDWRILDAVVADIGARAARRDEHDRVRRDDGAGRHDARRASRRPSSAAAGCAQSRSSSASSAPSASSAAACSATSRPTRSSSAA